MDFPECPIPENAVEVVTETWEDGSKRCATYHVEAQDIGFRRWTASGVLEWEQGHENGLRHGHFRMWYENGQPKEYATYIHGKEHGVTKQYNSSGVQIGSYIMDHGTGTDLWFDRHGILSEEREYRDGARHGYERWWDTDPDNNKVWEESHFLNDIEHGIFRRWNWQGRLSRGYPQYFVNGQRVTKRQYVRACKTDPTLPRSTQATISHSAHCRKGTNGSTTRRTMEINSSQRSLWSH